MNVSYVCKNWFNAANHKCYHMRVLPQGAVDSIEDYALAASASIGGMDDKAIIYDSIHEAINHSLPGSIISVGSGIYTESESILIDHPVTICGDGGDVIINLNDTLKITKGSAVLSKLSIRSLMSKGNSVINVKGGNLLMTECHLSCKGAGGSGIIIDDMESYAYIDNCRVVNAKGSGVYVAQGQVALYNNVISNNSQNGVCILEGVGIMVNNRINENKGSGICLLGQTHLKMKDSYLGKNEKGEMYVHNKSISIVQQLV